MPPSQQQFEFIVFRGSDVKDIKVIEEEEPKQPTPANIPNDPAILVRTLFFRPSICSNDEIFRMLITDLFRMRKTMWIFPLPSF